MSEVQVMEIVLETEDFQNFQVRQVPVSSLPYPRVLGCRVLLIGAARDKALGDDAALPVTPAAANI